MEHKNDNLHVKMTLSPGCLVKLDVAVTPQGCQAAHKKAVKAINKEVSVPGFRKGKAPEAFIVQNYGSYIDREWRNILLQTSFSEALNLCKRYPLGEKAVKKPQIEEISQESGAKLTFEFESYPEIPDVESAEYTLKKIEPKPVSEEQINDAIHDTLLQHAEWHTVEDRGVEEGDYVELDIESLDEPGRFFSRDQRFQVLPNKIGAWLQALIIGKSAGETVSGTSERSPQLDPSIAFKPTNCQITIKTIQTATLPALDDAFAKKLGAEDLQDFKAKLVQNLHSQAKAFVQGKYREQIEEQLKRSFLFDVPASMMNSDLISRTHAWQEKFKQEGKSAEEISLSLQNSAEEIAQESKEALRLMLIVQKLSQKHGIRVTEGELIREMLYSSYMAGRPYDRESMDEARSKAYFDVLLSKVEDLLIERATIE